MKNNSLKFGILVSSFFLFASCNAFGQSDQKRQNQEPPSVEKIFADLDKDEDGLISKKEVKGPLKNDFAKIDADEDGFISKEEMEKAPKPKRGKGRPENKK
ncbi:EF-hand domain-containing protein [Maribacter halichondriae]|uniref:EF-hand domain-containing protein n=1 Tax=Maribacter halichondriae TaxID=2980554 RepID=UPI002358B60C|nr:EF-hand domain-containing protein [Maribacter sp. Hal144]